MCQNEKELLFLFSNGDGSSFVLCQACHRDTRVLLLLFLVVSFSIVLLDFQGGACRTEEPAFLIEKQVWRKEWCFLCHRLYRQRNFLLCTREGFQRYAWLSRLLHRVSKGHQESATWSKPLPRPCRRQLGLLELLYRWLKWESWVQLILHKKWCWQVIDSSAVAYLIWYLLFSCECFYF